MSKAKILKYLSASIHFDLSTHRKDLGIIIIIIIIIWIWHLRPYFGLQRKS